MKGELAIFGGKPLFPNKIYLTRPIVPTIEELLPSIQGILSSCWLTNNGAYVQNFEEELKKFLNVSYCSVFCNGTLALQLAIQALGLSGEVITTPFSFPATTHVLYWNNITPIFCDIDPETYNIDTEKVESLILPKITGVLPVHVFGNPCEVKKIEEISVYHGLKVIYDAAHAFGVEFDGRPVGNYGDASMFSFHATKIFNTLEGGAIVCKEPNLHQRLRDLRNFGIRNEEEVIVPGINAKMNEIQAAFGILNLEKVSITIQKRKQLFEKYKTRLKEIQGLKFQKINSGIKYNYAYMIIEIIPEEFGLTRDQVYICMRKEGIMVRKYFYPLISNYSCYRALQSASKKFLPYANKLAERVLCLPLYEEMKKEIDVITEFLSTLNMNAKKIKRRLT